MSGLHCGAPGTARARGGEGGDEENGDVDLPVPPEPRNLHQPQLELRDSNQTFPYATTSLTLPVLYG